MFVVQIKKMISQSKTNKDSFKSFGKAHQQPDYIKETREADSIVRGSFKIQTFEIEVFSKKSPSTISFDNRSILHTLMSVTITRGIIFIVHMSVGMMIRIGIQNIKILKEFSPAKRILKLRKLKSKVDNNKDDDSDSEVDDSDGDRSDCDDINETEDDGKSEKLKAVSVETGA